MQLPVHIGNTTLVALLDSGSTHTFIKNEIAVQLGLQVQPHSGMSVKVANDVKVISTGVCPKLQFCIEEHFDHTCYVLPSTGFDIVLGVQWLRSLGPILWNFGLTMTIWRNGYTVIWHGIGTTSASCVEQSRDHELLPLYLLPLMISFKIHKGCPPLPPRRHDHHIRLLPGSTPIPVRPYRYPQLLKDEIECQCEDMLKQAIIWECTSTFSSPVFYL